MRLHKYYNGIHLSVTTSSVYFSTPHAHWSHHKLFVHIILAARAAIVVFGVNGETEKQYVYDSLKDGQETVSHQEGKHTHYDERQHPHGVFSLIV